MRAVQGFELRALFVRQLYHSLRVLRFTPVSTYQYFLF
jgi:hypothetical protein